MENKEKKVEKKEDVSKALQPEPAKMWEELNASEFKIFGLPNQFVSKFCSPLFGDATKLYLKYNHSSVLPQLEESFPKLKFTLEDQYIVVERKDVAKR